MGNNSFAALPNDEGFIDKDHLRPRFVLNAGKVPVYIEPNYAFEKLLKNSNLKLIKPIILQPGDNTYLENGHFTPSTKDNSRVSLPFCYDRQALSNLISAYKAGRFRGVK